MPAPYSLMDGRCLGRRKPSAVSDDRCNRSGRGYGGRFVLQFREAPPKLSAEQPGARARSGSRIPISDAGMPRCTFIDDPDIALGVGVFFVGELILSRLLYKVHLRDKPY